MTENNQNATWEIWIDTGGTFTDAIGISPNGQTLEAKVLSDGSLRASLTKTTAPNAYKISANWLSRLSTLEGFTVQPLHSSTQQLHIQKYNRQEQIISFHQPVESDDQTIIASLTTQEAAPILAARLLTGTPPHLPLPPISMRLGSTKGTNALLERKGARTILLITKGLKDLPIIGTQERPDIFALQINKPLPLHSEVIEVDERISAQGKVITPLEDAHVKEIITSVKASGAEAVAIALLHAYKNPIHELQLAKALEQEGVTYVSASSELSPSIKLYPRATTSITNAYIHPIISQYLNNVEGHLQTGTLKVMTSAGGLVQARNFRPKDSLLSGPAGGVVGAAHIGTLEGHKQLLTLDMGGTSTDVSRVDGTLGYTYTTTVGGATVYSPCVAIETVAAGGGSLCQYDGHKLTVGPESAGANPGPACYGRGGQLALTDINLLMGRLIPERFGIPVSMAKAKASLSGLLNTIGVAPDQAPQTMQGLLQIANEKMAEAIRKISVQQGYNPKDYALLAFGGAGGQHACAVANLLEIETIIIPARAGVLSAYGIGQARIERFATQTLWLPLSETESSLVTLLANLELEALEAIAKEGVQQGNAFIQQRLIYLRFQGQDSTLELNYTANTSITQVFKEKYQKLFGHWIEGRTIEIESLKVIAAERKQQETALLQSGIAHSNKEDGFQDCFIGDHWRKVPIYYWEQLTPHLLVEGPCIIASPTSTTFVELGWQGKKSANDSVILSRTAKANPSNEPASFNHAVSLELFTNRFTSLAEDMGAMLQRMAFSVNVKERLDFSCALLDPSGNLIVNAPHIPVHLGSLSVCAKAILAHMTLGPGDVAITNHPAFGGSHLPDITLLQGVFMDTGKLIGYLINRAHHAELGGTRPGSMPPNAHSLEEEGVVIPPMYLVKSNVPQWKAIEEVLSRHKWPTRALHENLADLKGALASLRHGQHALLNLVEKHGANTIIEQMGRIKTHAYNALKAQLQTMPQGTREAVEYLDDGSSLKVKVTNKNQHLYIDFTGTGPVHKANFNANKAITQSVVLYVLRLLVNQPIPLNDGLLEAVTLKIPSPSILAPIFSEDATKCPAVVGGNTETSQRLTDTLIKAFELAACSQGTMNNLLFGNDTFAYYETIGGGTGAGPGFHGTSAIHHHMTNTRLTDPEVMELRYPVMIRNFNIRKDSGGKGLYNGGHGIQREITFLAPVALTLLAQHRAEAPFGLNGGNNGQPGKQYVLRKGGSQEPLTGVAAADLEAGDTIVIMTPGGGGYGKPKTTEA